MQVPARAGAAEAAEREGLAGEALGNIPGRVDAQHEEGDAARVDALQRGEPVRDLLDAGAEQGAEPVDLVAMRLRRLRKGA